MNGRRDTWQPPETQNEADRKLIDEADLAIPHDRSGVDLIARLAQALEDRVNSDRHGLIVGFLFTVCLLEACAIAGLTIVYLVAVTQ